MISKIKINSVKIQFERYIQKYSKTSLKRNPKLFMYGFQGLDLDLGTPLS